MAAEQPNYTENALIIPHSPKAISAFITVSTSRSAKFGVILTHGASGDSESGKLPSLCRHLAGEGGLIAVRFSFKSSRVEARAKAMRKVLTHVFGSSDGGGLYHVEGCILGGHSMGSRAAVALATEIANGEGDNGDNEEEKIGTKVDAIRPAFMRGILAMSYPLHPPGMKNQLREQLLYDIPMQVPLMFISGTKDSFCDHDIMAAVRRKMLAHTEMIKLEGGDHSLNVGKAKDVNNLWIKEMEGLVTSWCERVVRVEALAAEKNITSDKSNDGEEEETETEAETERAAVGKRKRSAGTKTITKKATKLSLAAEHNAHMLTTIVELTKDNDKIFRVLKKTQ